MKFKKHSDRGAVLTEYIIILAFIGAVATAMMFDSNFTKMAHNVVEEVKIALGFSSTDYATLIKDKSSLMENGNLDGQGENRTNLGDVYSIIGEDGKLFKLEEGEYQLIVDIDKLKALDGGNDLYYKNTWACILLYDNEDGNGKANYDTGGRYANYYKGTEPGKNDVEQKITSSTSTLNFKVNSETGQYLAINVGMAYGNKNNPDNPIQQIAQNYGDIITLKKVN